MGLKARTVPCGGAGARVHVAVTTGLGVVFGSCWFCSAKLIIPEVCQNIGSQGVTLGTGPRANAVIEEGGGVGSRLPSLQAGRRV